MKKTNVWWRRGLLIGILSLCMSAVFVACGKKEEELTEEEIFSDDMMPLEEAELEEIENAGKSAEVIEDGEIIPEDEMLEEWAEELESAEISEDELAEEPDDGNEQE